MTDFELDPERGLWKPNRRGFLSMFIAAAVAPMLPDVGPPVLAASGWSSGATSLRIGDTFTIKGVFAINPPTFHMDTLEVFKVTKVTGSVISLERAP